MSEPSFSALIHNCPECHRGRLLSGFLALNTHCSECGLLYEQEEGQMWGAMVMAYFLSGALAIPLFFILLMNGATPLQAIGVPVLALTLFSPFNVRLSRLIWTHVMYQLHRGARRRIE